MISALFRFLVFGVISFALVTLVYYVLIWTKLIILPVEKKHRLIKPKSVRYHNFSVDGKSIVVVEYSTHMVVLEDAGADRFIDERQSLLFGDTVVDDGEEKLYNIRGVSVASGWSRNMSIASTRVSADYSSTILGTVH